MSHRHHHKDNTAKAVAVGGAIAAIAGFVAGVLTAPKSGEQTRKDIKRSADRGLSQAEKDFKRLQAEFNHVVDETKSTGDTLSAKAKQELDDLVTKAKDTKEKAREAISAVHEGETSDQDLKKAIEDANAAIEHLRTYIKKK